MLWALAQDVHTPAGPRVQAASILLKDLRETTVIEALDADEIVADLRAALGV
jgi:hypothetical protein